MTMHGCKVENYTNHLAEMVRGLTLGNHHLQKKLCLHQRMARKHMCQKIMLVRKPPATMIMIMMMVVVEVVVVHMSKIMETGSRAAPALFLDARHPLQVHHHEPVLVQPPIHILFKRQ